MQASWIIFGVVCAASAVVVDDDWFKVPEKTGDFGSDSTQARAPETHGDHLLRQMGEWFKQTRDKDNNSTGPF